MVLTQRETRRAFREIIRMISIDEILRDNLARFITPKRAPRNSYELVTLPDPDNRDIDTWAGDVGLNLVSCWNYLSNEISDNEGVQFAAEIAYEFKNRRPTKWKYKSWTTADISEYVTRKILRQQTPDNPWTKKLFLSHIFLGLGPWTVGDDVDDATTGQISSGSMRQRSFGIGPWPKGNGTGTS